MNVPEASQARSRWVFGSAQSDLTVFLVPLLAGYLLSLSFGNVFSNLKSSITIYGFIHLILNTGHVFGTAFPIVLDKTIRERNGRKIWLVPVLSLSLYGIVCWFSPTLFKLAFGLLTLLHVHSQHFNWLTILERRENTSARFQNYERLLMGALIAVPTFTWMSGRTGVSPSYMHANDLHLGFSFLDFRLFIWPTTAALVSYVLYTAWTHRKNFAAFPAGKVLLFMMTYGWLFGSLLFFKSSLMFFVYAIGSHTMSYFLFLGHGWNRPRSEGHVSNKLRFALPIACGCIGIVWQKIASSVLLPNISPNLVFLVWTPVILHYTWDGLIWKSGRKTAKSLRLKFFSPTPTSEVQKYSA